MKKKKMIGLPIEVEIKEKEKDPSQKFIRKLTEADFIEKNKIYLTNYINADFSIALSHIKKAHENYVCEGGWNEEKFECVMYEIIQNKQMLSSWAFLKTGALYDEGKIKPRIQRNEPTDEEILAIIRKNIR